VRKERKMKKQGNQPSATQKQQSTNEPKVIADEPMEDDEDEAAVEGDSPTMDKKQQLKVSH
jgi:hypothetical protein